MVDENDGNKLLKFARKIVESKLFSKKLEVSEEIKNFDKNQGVFVTIKKQEDLRGCIGYVIGHFPLYIGIKQAALSAAFEDPRFPPISKEEYDKLKFEISILSIPKKIEYKDPKELLHKIIIGKDGLIVSHPHGQGLLLPQVPLEWNWNVKEFLENTCLKAGLLKDEWKTGKCQFEKFQAQIFSE